MKKKCLATLVVIIINSALASTTIGKSVVIDNQFPLTFSPNLVKCMVYDRETLRKAILRATWQGECDWIVLKPGSDLYGNYITIQYEKPLVIADFTKKSKGHPLIITNETGKFVIFKQPKNAGCAMIIKKPNVVLIGISFEGAICYDNQGDLEKDIKKK